MLKDFRQFILRGNVVDLAVAVVIGAAFNSVVQAVVRDFITPLITGFTNKGTLVQGLWHVGKHFVFNWGDFITTLISFMLEALIIFVLVVQPINKLIEISKRSRGTDTETTKKCPECLSEVPIDATRCAFCTVKFAAKAD